MDYKPYFLYLKLWCHIQAINLYKANCWCTWKTWISALSTTAELFRGSEQVRGVRLRERWWHTAFGAATPVVFAIGCLYLLGEEEGRLVISVPANTGTPQWLKGNIPGSTEDHFTPECLLGERHACLLSVSYHKVLIYLIVSNFFTVFEHVLWKFCSAA